MYTLIDDLEFEASFLPLRDEQGAWRQFLWWVREDLSAIDAAIRENRVWTMIDGVDGCALLSGWHFVNRLHYVVTEAAVDPRALIEVKDLD